MVYCAYKNKKIVKYLFYVHILRVFMFIITRIGYFPLQCKNVN